MSLTVEIVSAPTPEACSLLAELDAELGGNYEPDQRHGLSVERLFQPDVLFFVARLNGVAIGCGGVTVVGGEFELKRMYVRPVGRGSGASRAILARLENEARARGANRLVLETGDAQAAAMRFYQREGFVRCPAFGSYARMPATATARSVFFEKPL